MKARKPGALTVADVSAWCAGRTMALIIRKLVGGCDTNHARGACPAPPCRRRDTSVPKETP